jgi:teichuronic acid biosynthesis glycosyltransferase TuaG
MTAAQPQVTVVVPAYNARRYLGHTLDSLLAQRGVTFEIIVVDDRSTDGTGELVLAYAQRDPRVHCIATATNCGGPAGPRNLGVERARTEWVAFCDADDLWHADKLRAQLDCASTKGGDLVCTLIEPFRDGEEPRAFRLPLALIPSTRGISLWQMLLKNRVATSSVLCRRSQLLKAGGFNTARSMVAVEDYDLWLRLVTQLGTKIVRIEQPLVAYRHLAGSLSASKWRQAGKIMRVHKSVFAIKGWQLMFPPRRC